MLGINRLSVLVILGIFGLTTLAEAQTQNYVAKFDANGNPVISNIFENGNVGIGNTSLPTNGKLQVNGLIDSLDTTLGAFRVNNNTTFRGGMGTSDWTGAGTGTGMSFYSTGSLFFQANGSSPNMTIVSGNVGIGTTSPAARLDVRGDVAIVGAVVGLRASDPNTTVVGGMSRYATNSGADLWASGFRGAAGSLTNDLYFSRLYGGSWADVMVLQNSTGNVGIGTTNPATKLEVAGNAKVDGSIQFSDGTSQTTAWTGVLCGGDYAESIDVSGEHSQYEPGDVLVIDDDHPGIFLKSTQPYSPSVAGVYSTKPGLVGRRQKSAKSPDEIPMAVIGIVPVKVTASNGAIHPHDLLVSSSVAGFAMKGTDPSRMLGAVIGKALGSLDSGTGVIEVLVNVQ